MTPGTKLCFACGHPVSTNSNPGGYFDDQEHTVLVDGKHRYLTYTQWKVLDFLRSRPGVFRSVDAINFNCWEVNHGPESRNNVAVQIHHIRRAIDGLPFRIRTSYRSGYVFEPIKEKIT